MNCAECRWWRDGVCHRHPPKVVAVSNDSSYAPEQQLVASTEWPITNVNDYCGEFGEIK